MSHPVVSPLRTLGCGIQQHRMEAVEHDMTLLGQNADGVRDQPDGPARRPNSKPQAATLTAACNPSANVKWDSVTLEAHRHAGTKENAAVVDELSQATRLDYRAIHRVREAFPRNDRQIGELQPAVPPFQDQC